MTLRTKTLLSIGVMLTSLIVILYLVAQAILLDNIQRTETRAMEADLQRAFSALSDMLDEIDTSVSDWATWDDTYQFVVDRNSEYIESNIQTTSFLNLHVNLIIYIDAAGEIVLSQAYDLENDLEIPPSPQFIKDIQSEPLYWKHAELDSRAAGFVRLPEGVLMFVSRPIITSEGDGPIRGALVMGRFLNPVEAARLAERVNLNLSFTDIHMPLTRQEELALRSNFESNSGSFIQATGPNSMVGISLVEDISGEPVLLMRIESSRDTYQLGRTSMQYLLWAMVGVGLALMVLTQVLFERLVLSRLARLSKEVDAIGREGDLSMRVSVSGKDELSLLSGDINETISALERAQAELRESDGRFRSLVENSPVMIYTTSYDEEGVARIYSLNPGFETLTGWPAEKWVGRPFEELIHPADHPVAAQMSAQIKAGERPDACELRIESQRGKYLVCEIVAAPYLRQGKVAGELGISRDITERKQAEETLRRHTEEQAMLHAVALAATESTNEDMLIERATQAIGENLYPDQFGVMLIDETGGALVTHPSYRGIREEAYEIPIPTGQGVTGHVASTGHVVRIGNVTESPMYIPLGSPAIRAELCVPLKVGERVIGVINTESIQENAFSQSDEKLLITVAGQLATAIARLRTEHAERHQASQLATIYDVGREVIGASLDPERVYLAIHQAVSRLMITEAFVITLVEPSREYVEAVYIIDRGGRYPARRFPYGEGLSGQVISSGESTFIPDWLKVQDETPSVHFGTSSTVRSIMAVPMYLRGNAMGTLSTQSYQPHAYTSDDLHLLELLAAYAAIALGNAHLYAETRRQALTFENMFDAVMLTDMEGRIIDWNSAAVRMFGFTKDEAIGKAPSIIHIPEDIPALEEGIMAGVFNHGRWTGEVKFVRKDGSQGVSEVVVVPLRDEKGDISALIGVNRDITERKQAEQALRTSEVRYRGLFEDSPISLWEEDLSELKNYLDSFRAHGIQDLSTYLEENPQVVRDCVDRVRIEGVNKTAVKMFRSGSKEGLGSNLEAIFSPNGYDLFKKQLVAIWEGRTEFEGEGVQGAIQGSPIEVHLYWSVAPGCEETLSSVIVSNIDLTLRRQREHELEGVALVSNALRVARIRSEMEPVILDQLLGLFNARGACLAMIDPNTGGVSISLANGDWAGWTGLELPGDHSITNRVIRTGEVYLSDSIQAETDFLPANLVEQDYAAAVVSLVAQDQNIGALWVGRDTGFRPVEVRLLVAVADIAANAIHRAILFEQTKRHAEQMATVSAIGRDLAQTRDVHEIYAHLAHAVQNLLPDIATVFVSLFDPEQELITCMYGLQDGDVVDVGSLLVYPLKPAGQGLQSDVIRSRQTLIVDDLAACLEAGHSKAVDGSPDRLTQSGLYVPLLSKGRVLGVLQVQSYTPKRFTQQDAELLVLVANTAAIAIENARLFEETELRLRRLAALRTMDVAISSSFDLRVTLSVLLDQVTTQLGVDAAAVLLFNNYTQTLDYSAGRGFRSNAITSTRIRLGEDLPGKAALEHRLISNDELPHLPGVNSPRVAGEDFVTYFGTPLVAKGQVKGVLEIFHRGPLLTDPEWIDYLDTLAGDTAIAIDSAALFNELQRSNTELVLAYDTTLEGWSRALELRDRETEGHAQRVAELTVELARAMGVPDYEIIHIRRGALLHDIGKMGVPDSILLKPGTLTDDEREIMQRHPVYAYQMLSHIPYLKQAIDIPHYHHEKWDATGYPTGLSGRHIPLGARIFAVVDVWDALRSERPYREPWTDENALEYVCQQAGSHFDPEVVEVFVRLIKADLGLEI